jgi:hypothetical protein
MTIRLHPSCHDFDLPDKKGSRSHEDGITYAFRDGPRIRDKLSIDNSKKALPESWQNANPQRIILFREALRRTETVTGTGQIKVSDKVDDPRGLTEIRLHEMLHLLGRVYGAPCPSINV